jgi:hypothetical protein
MNRFVGVFLLVTAAAPSAATTIDFDDIGVGTGGNVLSEEFSSRGFMVSSTEHLHVINDLAPTTTWNGTAWLGIHNDGANANLVTLTQIGGGLFDLHSLDIGEWFAYPNGVEVLITGTRGGVGVSRTVAVDGLAVADGAGPSADFGTVAFGAEWRGLESVTFEAVGGAGARWYALDNFVTTPVPEPSVLAMFLAGLGLCALPRMKGRRGL